MSLFFYFYFFVTEKNRRNGRVSPSCYSGPLDAFASEPRCIPVSLRSRQRESGLNGLCAYLDQRAAATAYDCHPVGDQSALDIVLLSDRDPAKTLCEAAEPGACQAVPNNSRADTASAERAVIWAGQAFNVQGVNNAGAAACQAADLDAAGARAAGTDACAPVWHLRVFCFIRSGTRFFITRSWSNVSVFLLCADQIQAVQSDAV